MKKNVLIIAFFLFFVAPINAQTTLEIREQDKEDLKIFVCNNFDNQIYTYGKIQQIVKEEILYLTRYTRTFNSYTSNLSSDSFVLSIIKDTENSLSELSSQEIMNEAIKTKCNRHKRYLKQ